MSQPSAATYGSLIGFKGAWQKMQVHAFLGTDPVITVGSNDLRWKTVQVVFAGGTVERAAAEHGRTAELKQGTTVSIGGLSGSGATYPSGLAMTVTFTNDTNMDTVMIDFTSVDTAIVSDASANQPTVAFDDLAPNGRVATIVQDDKNEMYAFAPGVEINTIEMLNDMATLEITALLDGLSVIPSAYFFGLAYLDGSGTAMAQEVPIAACSEALDPTIDGQVTFVSIKSDESPPPEFDLLIIVVGAFFFDPCETCGFPFVPGSTIEPEVCVPNAAGDACVTESDGATCYVSAPGCSCDGGDAACWKLAILGGPHSMPPHGLVCHRLTGGSPRSSAGAMDLRSLLSEARVLPRARPHVAHFVLASKLSDGPLPN